MTEVAQNVETLSVSTTKVKHKPYPTYRDSGIEWLGAVPEGWEVLPIKFIVEIPVTDGPHETPEFINDGIPFVSAEACSSGKINFDKIRGFISSEDHLRFSRKYKPKVGDVYLIKSGATTGVSTIVEDSREFNIWSPLAVIRCNETSNPYFLLNFLRSRQFQDAISMYWSFGTQQNIGMNVIENIFITRPPLRDQHSIANFLDDKTSKIDALIEKKQHLTQLLKEKRTALISHAVTKGLDPNAKMKDSGVEWLGEVPEGWEVRRLKRNLYLLTEKTDRRDNPVALENIESWTGRFIRTETEFEGEGIAFEVGDILFGKLRPYLAKAFLADSSGEAVGDFHVMRPVTAIDSRFAQYQILNREFIAMVDGSTFGSKMPRASWEFVGGMMLTTPPHAEQTLIISFLDRETSKIDALIEKVQIAIDKLKEYRTALISAAVTGKIDVREEVKNVLQ